MKKIKGMRQLTIYGLMILCILAFFNPISSRVITNIHIIDFTLGYSNEMLIERDNMLGTVSIFHGLREQKLLLHQVLFEIHVYCL